MFQNIDKVMKGLSKIIFFAGMVALPILTTISCIGETRLLEIKAWVYAGVKVSFEMGILSLFMYAAGDIVENIRRIREDRENAE